ncbi:MAG: hypothetical protein EAZ55_13365 [Cytophagales bacterium]|nr:MAG: hypothetical protein EAZ55_13365 [Cytophagales bacterium]
MAEIQVSGRMLVKTLKAQFKEAFGATLRVYVGLHKGAQFADDEATLASIRDEEEADTKADDIVIAGQMKVGNFEEKFADIYGIKVQVASPDNSKLVDNDITLSAAGKL